MPKVGMEPIRRQQLIRAAIEVIAEHGFAEVTVTRIAHAAGVSGGIIHHYFGGKNELLEGAMRSLLAGLYVEVSQRLRGVTDPRQRLYAIIDANFSPSQFSRHAIAAWLAFWSQSPYVPALGRLQRVNARRLRSNLLYALRQLLPLKDAEFATFTLLVLIDGLSLQAALRPGSISPETAADMAKRQLDALLDQHEPATMS